MGKKYSNFLPAEIRPESRSAARRAHEKKEACADTDFVVSVWSIC